jgi:hypothetical protein
VAEPAFTDPAGDDVLRFAGSVRNLSRVGELTDQIVAMAESGKWRRYRTALGVEKWRECEFDFFLISCDLAWDDVSRVLAWSHKGESLMPFMDPSANSDRRRTLEEAAAAWHAPGPETLVERARRLGWTKGAGAELRVPPIPERARLRHAGTTREEKEQAALRARIPAKRRRELDRLAKQVAEQTMDENEYRYVVERLRRRNAIGRPRQTKAELERWRRDAERLDWNTNKLAERWHVHLRTAQQRVARLRAFPG